MTPLKLLHTRRSVLAKELSAPGPSQEELEAILQAALRVPDHGKIAPWRFLVFQGEARQNWGKTLREIYQKENPEASTALLEFQESTFTRAPIVIALISSPNKEHKVPKWEQILSCGAVGQNILLAASSQGYGAQWLTEWYSYNEAFADTLKLGVDEKIAGFFYIGSYSQTPSERPRPTIEDKTVWME